MSEVCPTTNEACVERCAGPMLATHYPANTVVTRRYFEDAVISEEPLSFEVVCSKPVDLKRKDWQSAKFIIEPGKPMLEGIEDGDDPNSAECYFALGEFDNPTEVIVFTRVTGGIPDNT